MGEWGSSEDERASPQGLKYMLRRKTVGDKVVARGSYQFILPPGWHWQWTAEWVTATELEVHAAEAGVAGSGGDAGGSASSPESPQAPQNLHHFEADNSRGIHTKGPQLSLSLSLHHLTAGDLTEDVLTMSTGFRHSEHHISLAAHFPRMTMAAGL